MGWGEQHQPKVTTKGMTITGRLPMSHRQFQATVEQLLTVLGYLVYSIPDSRRASCPGFPDELAAHRTTGALVALELKIPPDTPTAEQIGWLAALEHRCDLARVVTPADFDDLKVQLGDLAGRPLR